MLAMEKIRGTSAKTGKVSADRKYTLLFFSDNRTDETIIRAEINQIKPAPGLR